MMFVLEFIGLILLIIIIAATGITLLALALQWYQKLELRYLHKKNTKYYIINKTGNIFKEYEDAVTRDKDLKEFNNMGFEFKAHNKIHTT